MPYFQPFEHDDCIHYVFDNRIYFFGIAAEGNPYGCTSSTCVTPPPINPPCINVMCAAKGYSWDISNEHQPYQNSLKLTVHQGDHPQSACYPNSRSEITFRLFNENNTTIYYSWRVFIPNDSEFVDEINYNTNNNQNSWHIISQILSEGDQNNPLRKLLSISYIHDINAQSIERDLYLRGYKNNDINEIRKRITITSGIKKGEWNEIIFKINWSEQDTGTGTSPSPQYGSFKIWINRRPIVFNSQTTSNDGKPFITAVIGNINEDAYEFVHPNMVLTNNQTPIYNKMQIESYRGSLTNNHTLYIDDYRITEEFPPPHNKTKLIYGICDTTLSANNLQISCYEIAGANNYKFRFQFIENGILETRWINSPGNTVNLANYDFIKPDKLYNIEVRVQKLDFGGQLIWENDYYESCQITIPLNAITNFTKIISSQCNQTMPQNAFLECYPVQNTTNYKFQFERNNQYYYVDSPINGINLNNYSFIQPGNTYNVSVRVQGPDFDNNYGNECFININPSYIISKSEEINNKGKIYPNPFSNQIYISSDEQINFIKVYSILGNLVFDLYQPKNKSFDLSFLEGGIYFFEINYVNSKREMFKILKK